METHDPVTEFTNATTSLLLSLHTNTQQLLIQSDISIQQIQCQLDNINCDKLHIIQQPLKSYDFIDLAQQQYITNINNSTYHTPVNPIHEIYGDSIKYQPIDTILIDNVLNRYKSRVTTSTTQTVTDDNNIARTAMEYNNNYSIELRLLPTLARVQYMIQLSLQRAALRLWQHWQHSNRQYKYLHSSSVITIQRAVRHWLYQRQLQDTAIQYDAIQYYNNRLLHDTIKQWYMKYNIRHKYHIKLNRLYRLEQSNTNPWYIQLGDPLDYSDVRHIDGVHVMAETFRRQYIYKVMLCKWMKYMCES